MRIGKFKPHALACLFLIGVSTTANAQTATDKPLDLTQNAQLTCETSAVILDVSPFKASQGPILIEMTLDDTTKPDGPGRWKATTSDPEHTSSFASTIIAACKPDCPFTRGKDGSIQLWSPKPMALTQIEDATTLVLININPTSLELKASSFRAKQLAALERGECKVPKSKVADPKTAQPATDDAKPEAAEDKASAKSEKQMEKSE